MPIRPMRPRRGCFVLICLLLAACAGGRAPSPGTDDHVALEQLPRSGIYKVGTPYQIKGVWYYPRVDYTYDETGIASWYGPGFHGKRTANGEIYDQDLVTAAHPTLPMPSLVRVTNLETGQSLVVRINDRGPFVPGRIIDLSRRSAQLLGVYRAGTAKVRVAILDDASRAIAAAAQSNTPVQIAVNEQGPVPQAAPRTSVQVVGRPPPEPARQRPQVSPPADVPGREIDGRFVPAAVVEQRPVSGRRDIFVQAGSFALRNNADRLRSLLSDIGPAQVYPAMVGDRLFHRVRIGPIATVDQADSILALVIESGNPGARVVVD